MTNPWSKLEYKTTSPSCDTQYRVSLPGLKAYSHILAKRDLQDGMEVRQGYLTAYQHPTPDERADAAQNDAQLVDAEWCRSGSHTVRVAPRRVSLKGVPRYLALSALAKNYTFWPVLFPYMFRRLLLDGELALLELGASTLLLLVLKAIGRVG